jgi:hypothetical protein
MTEKGSDYENCSCLDGWYFHFSAFRVAKKYIDEDDDQRVQIHPRPLREKLGFQSL